MFELHLETLKHYPQTIWKLEPTSYWLQLCEELSHYQPPARHLTLKNVERKWELVSSFQKSIRRADLKMALPLVSAMASFPAEWAYFWRRLTIIALEDVGPAAPELVLFVVVCGTLYTPGKTGGDKLYHLVSFLTDRLCSVAARSRVYCSLVVSAEILSRIPVPTFSEWEVTLLDWMAGVTNLEEQPDSYLTAWKAKNKWRGDGLLRYLCLDLPFPLRAVELPVPQHTILYGLPSCGYDMYTRTGRQMLKRLIQSNPDVKRVAAQLPKARNLITVVGECLFFVEGGRICGELLNPDLYRMEQRLFALQFGLPYACWTEMRAAVEGALHSGEVDKLRHEVLASTY